MTNFKINPSCVYSLDSDDNVFYPSPQFQDEKQLGSDVLHDFYFIFLITENELKHISEFMNRSKLDKH